MMRSALVSRHNPENLVNLKPDAFSKPGNHSDLRLKIPLRNCMNKLKTQNSYQENYQNHEKKVLKKAPRKVQRDQKAILVRERKR